MINFLDTQNVLSPFQHGFRKGLSTTTQFISCVHSLFSVLDKSGQTDVIFLDFSKAFDSIPNSKLNHKLNLIGFPSTIVKLVASYLSSRKLFVDINGVYSNPLPVNSGVLQEVSLGLYFFLFILMILQHVLNKMSKSVSLLMIVFYSVQLTP